MKTLEIFAGTQSFSKAVKRNSDKHEVVTVDILDKFKPTIKTDILTWDYKVYKPGYFDVIWCSPPCTEYSIAKTRGERNLELADSLVKKSFEIIDYFKPKVFIVENVGTGLLVKRMKDIRDVPMYLVDYCSYGKMYRKRTAIWSNIPFDFNLCCGAGKCHAMNGKKHRGSVGNGRSEIKVSSIWEKDAIPESLVDYIVEKCRREVRKAWIDEYVMYYHDDDDDDDDDREWNEEDGEY